MDRACCRRPLPVVCAAPSGEAAAQRDRSALLDEGNPCPALLEA
jgi:hypothetical protein